MPENGWKWQGQLHYSCRHTRLYFTWDPTGKTSRDAHDIVHVHILLERNCYGDTCMYRLLLGIGLVMACIPYCVAFIRVRHWGCYLLIVMWKILNGTYTWWYHTLLLYFSMENLARVTQVQHTLHGSCSPPAGCIRVHRELLVASRENNINHHKRQPSGWMRHDAKNLSWLPWESREREAV